MSEADEDVQKFVAGAMVEANPGVVAPQATTRRRAEREEHVPDEIKLGSWHWLQVAADDDEPAREALVCVTRVGSNYARVKTPDGHAWRVHFEDWDLRTRPAPDHRAYVDERLAEQKTKVAGLLEEVRQVTARLGMAPAPGADATGTALATLSGQTDVGEYKTALERAKADELPALFEKIKEEHQVMATWMKADMLPVEAMSGRAKDVLKEIDGRIFNVELYAGLTEQVTQVRKGEPAGAAEKLRVFQNRLYMDEECLLDYRAGGLDFKNIKEFDRWLAKPKNLERILPFPRCMVAMQVRRKTKDRGDDENFAGDLGAFIKFRLEQRDKLTFLYVRNGERLYRMNCELEFGELIFPSRDEFTNEPQVFRKTSSDDDSDRGGVIFITVREHEKRVEERAAAKVEREAWVKAHPFKKWAKEAKVERQQEHEERWAKKEAELRSELKKKASPEALEEKIAQERARFDKSYEHHLESKFSKYDYDRAAPDVPEVGGWEPFDKSSVHYDEALRDVTDRAKQWNRIALIIQGLFDRSDVLHPHPRVEPWHSKGFADAIELIYDGEHVLEYGEPPDFLAYAEGLRGKLGPGSVTIGQERAWLDREQAREAQRRRNDWRLKYHEKSVGRWWRPYHDDDPGPGFFATIGEKDWQPNARRAVFRWERKKRRERVYRGEVPTMLPESVMVAASALFNVSAYTPGDYLQFFRDPRTRADYIRWAPLLLSAEDWHAGKTQKEDDE
jgi:hypothetical protein